MGEGCYVGEVGCLLDQPNGPLKRTATIRAQNTSVLYSLRRDCLLRILDDQPSLHEYMLVVAISRSERMRQFDPAVNPNPQFEVRTLVGTK